MGIQTIEVQPANSEDEEYKDEGQISIQILQALIAREVKAALAAMGGPGALYFQERRMLSKEHEDLLQQLDDMQHELDRTRGTTVQLRGHIVGLREMNAQLQEELYRAHNISADEVSLKEWDLYYQR
jgi:hypothetical protein